MSFFRGLNNISGENLVDFSFEVKNSSAYTQDSTFTLSKGVPLWEVDGKIAVGTSADYTYSDSGSTKTATLKVNSLDDITGFNPMGDFIVGNLDFTGVKNLTSIFYNCVAQASNGGLAFTGITFDPEYNTNSFSIQLVDYTGGGNSSLGPRVDLSMMGNLGGKAQEFTRNDFLEEVIWPTGSTGGWTNTTPSYTNDHISMWGNGLTGATSMDFSWVPANSFNLHSFEVNSNSVDAIVFPPTNKFMASGVYYAARGFKLEGAFRGGGAKDIHLDLSPLSGVTYAEANKEFDFSGNMTLTGITWFQDSPDLGRIYVDNTSITSDSLDFVSYGITINSHCTLNDMTGATQVTFLPQVYVNSTVMTMHNCDWTGTINITGMTGLYHFTIFNNPNLTNLLLPISTGTFLDVGAGGGVQWSLTKAFQAESCDLGYVDFNPLSGATFNSSSSIYLQDNSMTATEVNHILEDLDTINWSGVTLDISGTNAAPDGSSGGFDGITALASLTGKTWSVTTT
tara:strand:- start:1886 stop:3415 length:1530 start_codon:yes stop_codon:yes gene_type:complete